MNNDSVLYYAPSEVGKETTGGDRLLEIAISNKMKIMYTFFKKRASRKWTWKSPNATTKNGIDFILTDNPYINHDVKTINKVNVGRDYKVEEKEENRSLETWRLIYLIVSHPGCKAARRRVEMQQLLLLLPRMALQPGRKSREQIVKFCSGPIGSGHLLYTLHAN